MKPKGLLILTMLLHVVMLTDADTRKPKVFLHDYVSYKNICREMDWVPKCNKQPPKGYFGKVVAFHAILSKDLVYVPPNTILKFGNVQANEGGGFDPKTGKFTTPRDGVYSFSWSYHTEMNSYNHIGGYVDGKLTSHVPCDGRTLARDTAGHLIIKLKKGRQFWIQTSNKKVRYIGKGYTFLSGFKLSGY